MFPEHAVKAYEEMDGYILQGRVLHILPAKPKVSKTLDTGTYKYYNKFSNWLFQWIYQGSIFCVWNLRIPPPPPLSRFYELPPVTHFCKISAQFFARLGRNLKSWDVKYIPLMVFSCLFSFFFTFYWFLCLIFPIFCYSMLFSPFL